MTHTISARPALTLALAVSALGLSSAALADHVALSNGDSLTGSIASVSKSDLALNTELAGRVTIKWSAVSQLTSTAPVRAGLPDGQDVDGVLAVAGGRISIARADGTSLP